MKKVVCSVGIVCFAIYGTMQFVSAAPPTQFKDRAAVMKRFDLDTTESVTALEEAAADIQQTLDPEAKTVDVLAAIEAKVLALSAAEKVDRATRAVETLKEAGIQADSAEVKAINQKLFGQDTVPDTVAVTVEKP